MQEDNILLLKSNETQVKLIDFEYTCFGPEEYDLANLINKMMIPNIPSKFPYFKVYFDNCPSIEEVEEMMRQYLRQKCSHFNMDFELYLEQNFDSHMRWLFNCILLNNLYWAFWAFLKISDEKINDQIFNLYFIDSWIDLYDYVSNHSEFKRYLN